MRPHQETNREQFENYLIRVLDCHNATASVIFVVNDVDSNNFLEPFLGSLEGRTMSLQCFFRITMPLFVLFVAVDNGILLVELGHYLLGIVEGFVELSYFLRGGLRTAAHGEGWKKNL